jgi:hypothetical protein
MKPNQRGSSQNHKAKNAPPTNREAIVVSQGLPFPSAGAREDCSSVMFISIFLSVFGLTDATVYRNNTRAAFVERQPSPSCDLVN